MSEKLKQICALILKEKNGDLSNLVLQKLLYFIQAGSLIYLHTPAFDEEIQAWQYGPVVPEAYKEFKYNKKELEAIQISEEFINSPLAELIRVILNSLRDMKPFDLVDLTHSYNSWLNAWNGGNQTITTEAIEKCHKELAKNQDGYIF
jgi:uncharacterized phage-associated protein